ncbi:hypothetical protein PR048_028948 [Dryococelus australis]|uniref:PiggyBac transposable element-derived protein domain-containing protein n=1 Tax=Dryococelus australis TaxID=614101 RepID=A0ABQ9GEM0_9NEOP|nr:hypothetical protein PR048_028948 [Dryococelus australis]
MIPSQERTGKKKLQLQLFLIFNKLVSNSQELYTIGAHACVDEALIPFRGRCRFRMYIPNKPVKYGIKLMCLTDVHNSSLLNSYIYVGKHSDGMTLSDEERKFNKPTKSVLRLAAPISGQVGQRTKKEKTHYAGTSKEKKKNKREVPKQILPGETREVGSSTHVFADDMTLLSHVPKNLKLGC